MYSCTGKMIFRINRPHQDYFHVYTFISYPLGMNENQLLPSTFKNVMLPYIKLKTIFITNINYAYNHDLLSMVCIFLSKSGANVYKYCKLYMHVVVIWVSFIYDGRDMQVYTANKQSFTPCNLYKPIKMSNTSFSPLDTNTKINLKFT